MAMKKRKTGKTSRRVKPRVARKAKTAKEPAARFAPEVHIAPDANALNHDAADLFVRTARKAVEERGRFMVVLSGGDGPLGLFRLLAEEPYRSDLPWDRTFVFWGDERHVPLDHPDSNYRMALDLLLSKVSVPPARLFPMAVGDRPPAQEAARYEGTLKRLFGGQGLPRFDLNLMGVGPDGHTASLFPGKPQLREKKRWVLGAWVDREHKGRITCTFPVFNASRLTLVLVPGPKKARILKEVLEGKTDPRRYPIQNLKAAPGGRLLFALDSRAAVLLKKRPQLLESE